MINASDFTGLRMQYRGEPQKPGEVACAIEHNFPNGRAVDHYYVTPSDRFFQDEGVQTLNNVHCILFLQREDGEPWQLLVHESSMLREVSFDFPADEMRRLLDENHVVLPGEPGFVMP